MIDTTELKTQMLLRVDAFMQLPARNLSFTEMIDLLRAIELLEKDKDKTPATPAI